MASGPSITEEQVETVRQSAHPVIAVNNTFQLAPWCDHIFAADILWWYRYYNEVTEVSDAKRWTLEGVGRHFQKKRGYDKILHELPFDREMGLGKTRVNHGGNSGYIAVNLAYLMGAKKIILIGYDHQHTNGQRHFHGDHDPKHFRTNADDIDRWVTNFAWLDWDLRKEGVNLVNCSTETALNCRRGNLEDEI
jgi:hypothetical protein